MKSALDTNILIRLLTADNKTLLKKAENFISKHTTKEIFVSYGVFIEIHFVLKSSYGWPQDQVLRALEHVVDADEFYVESETAVRLALSKAKRGNSFYDALIGEIGALRNVKTHTFDKGLMKNKSFVVIS